MGNLTEFIGGVSTTVVDGANQAGTPETIQMNIEVVTVLPALPDSNTLYLIRA